MLKCNIVKEAIRNIKKSKVLGPDRIAPIHLHHLGPIALRYLTDTINLCKQCKNSENLESCPVYTPAQAGKTHRRIKASDQLHSSPLCKTNRKTTE